MQRSFLGFLSALLAMWSCAGIGPAQGSLVSWGYDGLGQVSATPAGNDFVAVAAGGLHSVALRSNGSLVSWGYNAHGQVFFTPAGTGFAAVAGGFTYSVAIRSDGSLVSWGYDGRGEISLKFQRKRFFSANLDSASSCADDGCSVRYYALITARSSSAFCCSGLGVVMISNVGDCLA